VKARSKIHYEHFLGAVILCSWHKNTDVLEELAACIIRAALMMETAGFSEMMVYFYQTALYHIPENTVTLVRTSNPTK